MKTKKVETNIKINKIINKLRNNRIKIIEMID